jgi:hexosaminidase
LFYGVQTLRQLLPYTVEYTAAFARPMRITGVHVVDAPRYEYRGQHIDVARHFLSVSDVQQFMDLMAMYKLNRLHLHLSDDQGWRIEIPGWPNLTAIGGSSQVGGKGGGYYTGGDFRALVNYARDRFITIVPEIDMPGHTNAALASYPELNCDGVAPPLYTGTRVGFSLICLEKDITYKFIDDVIGAITELNPAGPYFHMGGDEVKRAGREAYNQFVERVEKMVHARGKQMIGWSEIALANLSGRTIVQSWIPDSAHLLVARGSKVILSPAPMLYLDMQYDTTTPIGLHWAAYVPLEKTYNWEPATYNPRIPDSAILGLEGALWSETLGKLADFEYMALPRLTALAELAWSPAAARNWELFRRRIPAHEQRWTALGLNYHRLQFEGGQ